MNNRFAFSAAVYARHEGAILLVHHKRMDVWLPVGGELEPGESPLAAAVRELQEETGLVPHDWPWDPEWNSHWTVIRNDGAPHGHIGYEEHEAGSKGIHGTHSFLFDVNSKDVKLCDEHHAFMWVDWWVSDLAEHYPMPPNVKKYLTLIRHGGLGR